MSESIMQNPLVKILAALMSLFLLVLIVNYGVTVYQKVAATQKDKETITISATGEVESSPDLAVANISVTTEGKDPKTVQDQNSDKINKVTKYLKDSGIAEADIKTQNYNLYPRYDYTDNRQVLAGYTLYQTVTIKMRDLTKVGEIMKGVVENGANAIDSLTFTIDKPNDIRQEARKKALENAKAKAEELAKVAGLSLGKVKSFSESGDSMPQPVYYDYSTESRTMGMGGGGAAAPDVQPGSTTVTATVYVTFELK
ncbi:MAG: SIMPL domain-containing protein [Patescibacteria group bacterium]|nr:SIMPL domain-containing protein [Patescibacteria group bacterium]